MLGEVAVDRGVQLEERVGAAALEPAPGRRRE